MLFEREKHRKRERIAQKERERERVLPTYRGVRIISVILGVKLLADVPGPRPEGAYVEGQGILVRGRC